MVTPSGISMDTAKTDVVSIWPTLTNLKAVQAFLGFAKSYRRFIVGFSEIVIPLIHLTRKDTPFTWGPDHTEAFETLKTAFTQAPILVHFNPDTPIVVETDASDYAITAIISQISPNDGNIHPIMFYLHSMQPAELNYKIYDKELLAIFEAFRQWHNYLEGSAHVMLVLSDHKNLEYFATTKQLTRRQVHWSEYLSGFNYLIHYRAGRLGTKPDALTRHEDVYPRGENAYALANPHNFQSMFKAGTPNLSSTLRKDRKLTPQECQCCLYNKLCLFCGTAATSPRTVQNPAWLPPKPKHPSLIRTSPHLLGWIRKKTEQ